MKKCDLSGKARQYGRNVSFSQRRTSKVWQPNLQRKRLVINGQKVRLKVTPHALRTLKKRGLVGRQPKAGG